MIGDPYESDDEDPACYPGTTVLRNLQDLQDCEALEAFELEAVGVRILQLPPKGDFNPQHYRGLHRHLFQDVYAWAGEYRTIRTAKGGNWFCFPEHIESQMDQLFGRLKDQAFQPQSEEEAFIAAVADFLGYLNAIHPFREGNGRTQLYFLHQLGLRADHPFRSESVEPEAFQRAMIESFDGDVDALIDELERMLA